MAELQFEWDEAKAATHLKKHGVAFAEAQTVFVDDFARLIPDPDHASHEERFILLGNSNQQRLLLVCHCERDESSIRIISARKADKHERKQYESFRYA